MGRTRTNIHNTSATHIDPATEQTVSRLVMSVDNALDFTSYDLNASAFSETTAITNDYTLDNIEFNFTTSQIKTITVTSSDGTTIYNDTNSNTQIFISDIDASFNGGENITVTVSQTSGACSMDCVLKIRQGSNALAGNPTIIISTKKYHPSDPDFYKPRGNMFSFATRGLGFDYNFAGNGTKYPNSTNGFANGKQLLWGGKTVVGEHGVYLAPADGQVMYVSKVVVFFNHTTKNLFDSVYKDSVKNTNSAININHSGSDNCKRYAPYGLSLISDDAPVEIADAFGTSEYFYAQNFPLDIPSRFDGDNDEYFGLRTEGGNAVYLGASLAMTKLSHFHIMFHGWVVDKVNGNEIIQHTII